jgi:hypothetical protein
MNERCPDCNALIALVGLRHHASREKGAAYRGRDAGKPHPSLPSTLRQAMDAEYAAVAVLI